MSKRSTYPGLVLRLMIYLAVTGGLLAILMRMAAVEVQERRFTENDLIENTQVVVILLAGMCFALAARRWTQWRAACTLCAMLTLVGAIRELDHVLDHALPVVGWQGPAVAVLIGGAVLLRPQRKALWDTFGPFVGSPAGMLSWIGLAIVVVFAQIIGEGNAWKQIMQDSYNTVFKRTLEELVELVGYMHLLYAGLEAWCGPPRHLPEEQTDPPAPLEPERASE